LLIPCEKSGNLLHITRPHTILSNFSFFFLFPLIFNFDEKIKKSLQFSSFLRISPPQPAILERVDFLKVWKP